MGRTSWIRVVAPWVTILGAVYVAARPAPAAACTLQPDSVVVSDAPADGVVIVTTHCFAQTRACFEGGLPDELEVVDRITREPVPGAVVRVEGSLAADGKIAWRPDAPLTPRRQYEVTWQPTAPSFALLDYVFDVLPEASWDASDIVMTSRLEMLTEEQEHVSCTLNGPSTCGSGSQAATFHIATKLRTYPALAIEVDATRSPQSSAEQLVLSAAFWVEGEDEPALQELPWLNGVDAWHEFAEAAESYCYRVQVKSLIDDSLAMHEGCEEHGDLGQVGTRVLSENDNGYKFAACAEAPEGFEDVWCRARAEVCETAEPCEMPAECEGDEGDPNAGDDAGMATPFPNGQGDKGCSVQRVASSRGYGLMGVAVALLAWRRRRSGSTCAER